MNHIYAIVKIPIEIKPDKSYTILSERIYTTVEKCDELPPINTNQNNDIMQQIKAIVPPVVKRFVAAAAGVKTNAVSPAVETS